MVWWQGAERPGSWLAAAGGRAHRHQVLALQVEQEPRGIRSLQEGVQGAVAGGRGAWRQGAGAERSEGVWRRRRTAPGALGLHKLFP